MWQMIREVRHFLKQFVKAHLFLGQPYALMSQFMPEWKANRSLLRAECL